MRPISIAQVVRFGSGSPHLAFIQKGIFQKKKVLGEMKSEKLLTINTAKTTKKKIVRLFCLRVLVLIPDDTKSQERGLRIRS